MNNLEALVTERRLTLHTVKLRTPLPTLGTRRHPCLLTQRLQLAVGLQSIHPDSRVNHRHLVTRRACHTNALARAQHIVGGADLRLGRRYHQGREVGDERRQENALHAFLANIVLAAGQDLWLLEHFRACGTFEVWAVGVG